MSLALFEGCGTGGSGPGEVTVRGPDLEGSSGAGGGIYVPPPGGIITDCSGSSCMLGGVEVVIPPGCGDATRTDDEACDDGNRASGDGCDENCLLTEPGFSCATAGQPCRQIARCGDSIVAATEQCDDGNIELGDGCSDRCRVELGKKCEGEPSVCSDAVCGNNIKEGAESCDDGNTTPFDGCSPLCLVEPNCEGQSCVSDCGDGLIINEACDDGNVIDGDGCSATCQIENGFGCVATAACQLVNGQCTLRVPAIFRDFTDSHPDFGETNQCTALALNATGQQLDAEGKPTISATPAQATAACLSTGDAFAQWYRSSDVNQTLVGEVTLFDNGRGGYVNRFGANGEEFGVPDPTTERNPTASVAACGAACRNTANNELQCANECRPLADDAQQLTNGPLIQLTNALNQENNEAAPDPVVIADLEAQIADVQAQIVAAQAGADDCLTDCNATLELQTANCTATCKPCSFNPAMFCIGGVLQSFPGNPLFFPVDSFAGTPTYNPAPARIPDQYGTVGFPGEAALFPGQPAASYLHNFYFTSEVQYWFKYDADTVAQLDFLGDDDVWVFLNGRLAVDLGGIHVPSRGSVTINAGTGRVDSTVQDGREGVNGLPAAPAVATNRTPADYGLVEGNVYTIKIFQAERKRDGSSFQLTLAGFEATPSDCTAVCGDDVLSFGEECDDGVNDGGYNECDPGCKLGPFCGDGVQQLEFGEQCDVGPIGDATCRGCRIFRIR